MKRILIIGTGGLAREFTTWFSSHVEIVGYASTDRTEHHTYGLPGRLFAPHVTAGDVGTTLAVVAIGTPAVRVQYQSRLADLGFEFPIFVHPSATVSAAADLEEGVVVAPQCVVSCNVKVGKLAYINFGCGIGHDVQIGRFVQVNPGTQIGGWCRIGEGAMVGSGSTLLPRIDVGARATIGSGSVVFSSVEDASTVLGNPARRMRALENGNTSE